MQISKVTTLPATLDKNTLYCITGTNDVNSFDLILSNNVGTASKRISPFDGSYLSLSIDTLRTSDFTLDTGVIGGASGTRFISVLQGTVEEGWQPNRYQYGGSAASGYHRIGYSSIDGTPLQVSFANGPALITGMDWQTAFEIRPDGKFCAPFGIYVDNFAGDQPVTADYVASRGDGIITNYSGLLGNDYNFSALIFDPLITPGLPGAFRFDGYGLQVLQSDEFITVDPNQIYFCSILMREQSEAGDWSAYTNDERQLQYVGVLPYDSDKNPIYGNYYERFREGGNDSYTTLTQALTPGDTVIHVDDASGWNTSTSDATRQAIGIFEYKNTLGFKYDHYTRHVTGGGAFDTTDVDVGAKTITLNAAWAIANPDDGGGVWPIGTRIANSIVAGSSPYVVANGVVIDQTDTWRKFGGYIGKINTSGTFRADNFPPGTASVKFLFLPNYLHTAGSTYGYADAGASHSVWFAAPSVTPAPYAKAVKAAAGDYNLFDVIGDTGTGIVSMTATVSITNQAV